MAAAVDLESTRELAAELDKKSELLTERLRSEENANGLAAEMIRTQASAISSLKDAIKAKDDAAGSKDAVIAAQEKLIESLRRKRSSPWSRIRDILIGAGAVLIFK